MAIMVNPPQPQQSWSQLLSPIGQMAASGIAQKQQQERNISESSILNKAIQDTMQSKGQNMSAFDLMQAISGAQQQGVSPQMAQQYLEAGPKFADVQQKTGRVDPAYMQAMAEMRKAQAEEHKQAYEINKPIIDPLQQSRGQLDSLDASLDNALMAVNSGKVGSLSPSHLAELSGWSSQLAPEGKLLKNAMKDYYGLVKKYFGGNPSDWESKQIEDLLAKVGSNEHANRVAIYTLKGKNDIDRLAVRTYDEIVKANGGTVPYNLGEQMAAKMAPARQQVLSQMRDMINQEMTAYNYKPPSRLPSYSPTGMQKGEGGQTPGSPSVMRNQGEKPIMVRHKKTGQTFAVPRAEYRPHPDIEAIEGMNQ